MKTREKIRRYDASLDCVHCGLCLEACPTYKETGRETASPRGRIYTMRGMAEGHLEQTASTVRDLDSCLVCRACEPVCPSGVEFGAMMELTRDLVEESPARNGWTRRLKRAAFRHVLPHPNRLRLLVDAMGLLQWTGLRTVAQKLGIPGLFGPAAALRDAMTPTIPAAHERSVPPEVTAPDGPRKARVGFLVGCVAHELLPDANRATIAVLRRNGCEVHCPSSRPCCGALPLHFGDLEGARRLARRMIETFEERPLDAIVVSSAGCGSAMKDVGRLFEDDASMRPRAESFAAKVRDLSEFLESLPWTPPKGTVRARVAYDEPCHLAHAQRIREAPRRLLAAVPGVELVDFVGQEDCCGAAGLYSMLEPEASVTLLETKMGHLKDVDGLDLLVTANPGCHLSLRAGAASSLERVEVLHMAELLERSYARERNAS